MREERAEVAREKQHIFPPSFVLGCVRIGEVGRKL